MDGIEMMPLTVPQKLRIRVPFAECIEIQECVPGFLMHPTLKVHGSGSDEEVAEGQVPFLGAAGRLASILKMPEDRREATEVLASVSRSWEGLTSHLG